MGVGVGVGADMAGRVLCVGVGVGVGADMARRAGCSRNMDRLANRTTSSSSSVFILCINRSPVNVMCAGG